MKLLKNAFAATYFAAALSACSPSSQPDQEQQQVQEVTYTFEIEGCSRQRGVFDFVFETSIKYTGPVDTVKERKIDYLSKTLLVSLRSDLKSVVSQTDTLALYNDIQKDVPNQTIIRELLARKRGEFDRLIKSADNDFLLSIPLHMSEAGYDASTLCAAPTLSV